MREPYFDGKNVTTAYRNPWKEMAPLNGTDSISFSPNLDKNTKPWAFLDDISRNGGFHYHNTQSYKGLTLLRFLY